MSKTFKFGLSGIGENVQLGNSGPRIKTTPTRIQFRNSDDTNLKQIQIAEGVLSDDAITKQQMEEAIEANKAPGALNYKGVFNASVGNYNALADGDAGNYYKVSVAGTIDASGVKEWCVGDSLILNKKIDGIPTDTDVDKIDNTESEDILRTENISNNLDFNIDKTKIVDRETIAAYVGSKVGARIKKANFSYNSQREINIGTPVEHPGKVRRVHISVVQAFNGTLESTLAIGVSGYENAIVKTFDIDLMEIGEYEITCNQDIALSAQLIATYVADGATEGVAEINIEII